MKVKKAESSELGTVSCFRFQVAGLPRAEAGNLNFEI